MGKSRDAFCWRINNRIAWLQSSASLTEGLYSIWFGRSSVMPTVGCRGDLDWLKLGEGLRELSALLHLCDGEVGSDVSCADNRFCRIFVRQKFSLKTADMALCAD